MYAKKSLGQHFLKSERALSSIIGAANISPNEIILEIGPGLGVLTEKLLQAGAKVVAVEKDDNLFQFLKEKFGEKINLIHGDILDFNPNDLGTYKLVANIPYNITGRILEKFLSAENQPKSMILLVQREVAERIVSRDGKESILSISVKAYGNPRYIEKVLAGSFVPTPQVDSAIIAIENISKEFFKNLPEDDFFKVLKSGFKSKRKKLSSNLSTIFDKSVVSGAFSSLNLNENARAEEIGVEIWHKLAQNLVS